MSEPYPEDWEDDERRLPYAFEDNGYNAAYLHGADVAHILPAGSVTGDGAALCGAWPEDPCSEGCWNCGWFGTGDWDELLRARRLPLCQDCVDTAQAVYPKTCDIGRKAE